MEEIPELGKEVPEKEKEVSDVQTDIAPSKTNPTISLERLGVSDESPGNKGEKRMEEIPEPERTAPEKGKEMDVARTLPPQAGPTSFSFNSTCIGSLSTPRTEMNRCFKQSSYTSAPNRYYDIPSLFNPTPNGFYNIPNPYNPTPNGFYNMPPKPYFN